MKRIATLPVLALAAVYFSAAKTGRKKLLAKSPKFA